MAKKEAIANYSIVKDCLKKTNAIVKRKLYSLNELYSLFQTEVDYNYSITIRSFTIAISKSITSMNKFSKVEIASQLFKYGFFPENDSDNLKNCIRRSQQNRKGKIASHPLGKIVKSPIETESDPDIAQDTDESQSFQPTDEETNSGEPDPVTKLPQSERIAGMSKMDLHMALTFFFGKERAKEFKRIEEIKSNQQSPITSTTSSY